MQTFTLFKLDKSIDVVQMTIIDILRHDHKYRVIRKKVYIVEICNSYLKCLISSVLDIVGIYSTDD